jgi:hypothetical protein
MPSLRHEVLRTLVQHRPLLAVELLTERFQITLPSFSTIGFESADLTQVVPTEYRADGLLVLRNPDPVFCIVWEVQLGEDPDKRWSWPAYVLNARALHRCPAALLVVAVETSVAQWAATPIAVGPPSNEFHPLVLGPELIPVQVPLPQARACPELVVLSALAHGHHRSWTVPVAKRMLKELGKLDRERAALYTDLLMASLAEQVRTELENLLMQGYEYQSNFVKNYLVPAHQKALEEGLEKGLQKGLKKGIKKGVKQGIKKGLEQGREQGLEEGRVREAERALKAVLKARGFSLSSSAKKHIENCHNVKQLEAWLRRAVTVPSLKSLFSSPLPRNIGCVDVEKESEPPLRSRLLQRRNPLKQILRSPLKRRP